MTVRRESLYLMELSSDEIEMLRVIIWRAKQLSLFEQSRFIGDGMDIRNIYPTPAGSIDNYLLTEKFEFNNIRPTHKLIVSLYNYIMTELRQEIIQKLEGFEFGTSKFKDIMADDKMSAISMINDDIEKLIDMGIDSGRYKRDINFYLKDIANIDASAMSLPVGMEGLYIGFRASSSGDTYVTFLLELMKDRIIDRTIFKSYTRLSKIERKTVGFAYMSRGTIFLSGFNTGQMGNELMCIENIIDDKSFNGIMITINSHFRPAVKRCFIVSVDHTVFSLIGRDVYHIDKTTEGIARIKDAMRALPPAHANDLIMPEYRRRYQLDKQLAGESFEIKSS